MKIETFISHKEEFLEALESQLMAAMHECALDAQNYAQDNIIDKKAVDTGNLLGSISYATAHSGDTFRAIVGTNVEYAEYVENGTYKMAARPYLKPSIADHKEHYISIIRKHLQS